MSKTLKSLIALAQREDATSAELIPAVPQAEAELTGARQAQVDAEQAYHASMLVAAEAETHRLDTAQRDAGHRIARAEALVGALRERLAVAQEREAEMARVERFEAVRRQADEAREALRIHYPELATDIVTLLRVIAEAELAVKTVNADLPRGVEPLARVERSIRDYGGFPKRITRETTVELWCLLGSLDPDAIIQSEVKKGPKGTHYVTFMGSAHTVVLRRLNMIEHTQEIPLNAAEDLALRIMLPGLNANDPVFWEPQSPLHGRADPQETLAKIRNQRPPSPRRTADNLPVEVKYEAIGFYDLEAETRTVSTTGNQLANRRAS